MEHKQHYSGLSEQEVKENRAKFGDNVLTPPIQTPIWKKFIAKFNDPLIVILLIAGVFSVGISCYEYFGSVLKPSCKPILLSTQFHKPI